MTKVARFLQRPYIRTYRYASLQLGSGDLLESAQLQATEISPLGGKWMLWKVDFVAQYLNEVPILPSPHPPSLQEFPSLNLTALTPHPLPVARGPGNSKNIRKIVCPSPAKKKKKKNTRCHLKIHSRARTSETLTLHFKIYLLIS